MSGAARALVILAALGLGAGCKADPPRPAPAEASAPADPAPPPARPADAGPGDDCVEECERRNMARAVAADLIRADCARECGVALPPPKAGSSQAN